MAALTSTVKAEVAKALVLIFPIPFLSLALF